MSSTKKWLIAAAILVVLGLISCGVAYAALGFNFNKLETAEYVTNTYEVSDPFNNINIKADTEKINLVYAKDGICKVVCVENVNDLHDVRVEDNNLKISRKTVNGTTNFSFGFNDQSITVYLPEYQYGNINIISDTGKVDIPVGFGFDNIEVKTDTGYIMCNASANQIASFTTDTGAIKLTEMNADSMSIKSDTGYISLSDITSGDLNLKSDTGKVDLKNTIAGTLNVNTNTGSIKFDMSDADSIRASSDTGSITGTLLSDKIFKTQSDTGKITVPASGDGGDCELITNTGKIDIEVVKK